jgi:hypothetical protein
MTKLNLYCAGRKRGSRVTIISNKMSFLRRISLALGLALLVWWNFPLLGQNLVPNANMESYVCCPTGTFQYNCIATWTNPNTASPEYFNACGSGGGDVPANSAGNQAANSGNGYVGLIIGWSSSNYREYCQVQLTSPLTAGQTYSISYWVSLADGSQYSTDRFEAYLSPTSVSIASTNVLPYVPQIAPSTGFLGSKSTWEQVCGTFVAAGGERYLIIGNFKNSGSTTLTYVSPGLPFCQSGGYYYVDDAAVVAGSGGCIILPVELASFTAERTPEGSVFVQWIVGPENGVEKYILERSNIHEGYKAVTELPAQGRQAYAFQDHDQLSGSVYYRLKTVDHDGQTANSHAIRVDIDGESETEGVKGFFPSPAKSTETVHIDYLLDNAGPVEVKLIDQTGRVALDMSKQMQEGLSRMDLDIQTLKPGTYFVAIRSEKSTAHKKLIVKE